MMTRPPRINDRVSTASRTRFPVVGTIKKLNPARRTVSIEWDDKTAPVPRELPLSMLRYVAPDECPLCGGTIQHTTSEWVKNNWRRINVRVDACTSCEYVEESPE